MNNECTSNNFLLLKNEVAKRKWYHKIDLGFGIVTPGFNFDVLWDNIRQVRSKIDYTGKRVLDLGSFDGMWSFEAEKLGAGLVVATDCDMRFDNFFFCKQILNSKVEAYFNVPPHALTERLDSVIRPWGSMQDCGNKYFFDIVQHLGLLYHLTDPMTSLFQARSVMKRGAILLIETALIVDDDRSYLRFNGCPIKDDNSSWFHIYDDPTTWWAPTFPCLEEMLTSALFKIDRNSIKVISSPPNDIGRICLAATAIAPQEIHPLRAQELYYDFRIPGIKFDNL